MAQGDNLARQDDAGGQFDVASSLTPPQAPTVVMLDPPVEVSAVTSPATPSAPPSNGEGVVLPIGEVVLSDKRWKRLGDERLRVDDLLDRPVEPIQWAVEQVLTEDSVTLLSGASYIGKTYLLMDLGIQLALAGRWLNHFEVTRPFNVAYFDKEMPRAELARRFQRMLKSLPADSARPINLHIFPYARIRMGTPKLDPELVNFLRGEAIDAMLVDSVRRLVPGDENDSQTPALFLDSFNELRASLDKPMLFVGIHHWNKESHGDGGGDQRDINDRLRGSSAWLDTIDSHWAVKATKTLHHLSIRPGKIRSGFLRKSTTVRFHHLDPNDLENCPFYLEVMDENAKITDNLRVADFITTLCCPEAARSRPEIAEALDMKERAVRFNTDNLLRESKIGHILSLGGRGKTARYWSGRELQNCKHKQLNMPNLQPAKPAT